MTLVLLWLFASLVVGQSADSDLWCDYGNDIQVPGLPNSLCLKFFGRVKTPRDIDIAPNGDIFIGSPEQVSESKNVFVFLKAASQWQNVFFFLF